MASSGSTGRSRHSQPRRAVPTASSSSTPDPRDGSSEKLAAAAATQFVTAGASSFGAGISVGLRATAPDEEDEWLWLLSADTAPEQDALRQLLAAVEVAPSVAIAGPKLVDPDRSRAPAVVRREPVRPRRDGATRRRRLRPGVSTTPRATCWRWPRPACSSGARSGPGWPASTRHCRPSTRASTSRSGRAWPDSASSGCPARGSPAGQRPEDFGRRRPDRPSAPAAASAGSLSCTVGSSTRPAIAMPFHWLALLPLAVIRAIGHLFAKRPGAVGGRVHGGVRRRVRRRRPAGPASAADHANRRMGDHRPAAGPGGRAARASRRAARTPRAGTRAGAAARARLVPVRGHRRRRARGRRSASRCGRRISARPPSRAAPCCRSATSPRLLWSQLGWGWREIGVGFDGAADPFTAVLALLGSATWWSTSFSLVVVWAIALPLAALGAWWCATRLSPAGLAADRRRGPLGARSAAAGGAHRRAPGRGARAPPAAVARARRHRGRPFLECGGHRRAALRGGHGVRARALPGAAHRRAVLGFRRTRDRCSSFSGSRCRRSSCSARSSSSQLARGTPLGSIIDPGAVAPFVAPLRLGAAARGSGRRRPAAGAACSPRSASPRTARPRLSCPPSCSRRSQRSRCSRSSCRARDARSRPSSLALAGLATAVASVHFQPAAAGAVALGPWPGSGLSLYWLGLVGAAVVALHALGRARLRRRDRRRDRRGGRGRPAGGRAAPRAGRSGAAAVSGGNGRLLPAIVLAEASADPDLGTLRLEPQDDGSLAARIERGEGTMLDDQSTLYAGPGDPDRGREDPRRTRRQPRLAQRVRPGAGTAAVPAAVRAAAARWPRTADPDAREVRQRAAEALDAVAELTPVGESAYGIVVALRAARRHRASRARPRADRHRGARRPRGGHRGRAAARDPDGPPPARGHRVRVAGGPGSDVRRRPR